MINIPYTSWKELKGNKYAKSLELAMLTEQGYINPQRMGGNQHKKGEYCNVIYDRDYIVAYLTHKVIKPLTGTKKEEINLLIQQAYDNWYGRPEISKPTNKSVA